MLGDASQFYDEWSTEQLMNSDRTRILKWKAVNLANLFLRSIKDAPPESICEIGGAEGTILDIVGKIFAARKLTNYDVSSSFCQYGAKLYPHIIFMNEEFSNQQKESYDLIICSDIIEHVKQEDIFLKIISQSCRYALFKIPLEKCLINSVLWYWLHGQSKPTIYQFGSHHYNGHLRGYTLHQAIKAVTRGFAILDTRVSHVAQFCGGQKQQWLGRHLGEHITTWLFGGAVFILGVSKIFLQREK